MEAVKLILIFLACWCPIAFTLIGTIFGIKPNEKGTKNFFCGVICISIIIFLVGILI